MTTALTLEHMEQAIRTYFDGCNRADIKMMTDTMAPEAVHYFPGGAPQGPFISAQAIAEGWVRAVQNLGSLWTVDSFIGDVNQRAAVIEWTHWKTKQGVYLRGDEWYRFDEQGRILEIRAYYACPPQPGTPISHELGGFDYAGRGFPLNPPKRPT